MGKQKDSEPNNSVPLPDQADNFGKMLAHHIGYKKYLKNFENCPPLAGCTGPMSFNEWDDFMNAVEPLLNLSKPPVKTEEKSNHQISPLFINLLWPLLHTTIPIVKEGKKDSEPKSVEIRFGMMFAHWFEKSCSIHIVVEMGEKNWFETSAITRTDGKIVLGLAGTAGPEDVHLVLGRLTKEQIIEGYDNWFKESTPKSIIEVINREAGKPPRIINY